MPGTSAQTDSRTLEAAVETLSTAGNGKYKRDRLTWYACILNGFWAFAWGLFSPIMPFLRSDLKLSYTTAALHFSALAFGLLMAGLFGPRIHARISRPSAIKWGTAASAFGLLTLIPAGHHFVTIAGALIVGFCGSIAGQAIISGISDRSKEHRATAIAEIVMLNSLFAAAAPLTVAAVSSAGLPWKAAIIVPFITLALGCWVTKCGGGISWPPRKQATTSSVPLPAAYWAYFAIIFMCVAAEWSITFWCPDYLEKALHFSRTAAVSGLSVFLTSMLAGRVLCSKLASRFPTNTLLIGATLVALAGFLIFWLSHQMPVIWAGLILLGLGESNCYPLALAAAIGTAPQNSQKATSRMSVSTGFAILLAPLFLGIAADKIGIMHAYGIVAGLLLAAAITAFSAISLVRFINMNNPCPKPQ